jgi:hypothetical protein
VVHRALQRVGFVEGQQNLGTHGLGLLECLHRILPQAFEHDDELVPTEPGHGVALAHAGHQALAHVLQQQVADVVSTRVVEALEVVQIDEEQRSALLIARTHDQRVLQAVQQQPAVGQARQRVGERQQLDAFLVLLLVRDVREGGHIVGGLALGVAHGRDGQPLWVHLAVLAPVPDLALPAAMLADRLPHAAVEPAVVPHGLEHARRLADHLVARIAGDGAERPVHADDGAVLLGDDHTLGAVVEHRGCLAQVVFHALALGDVQHHAHQSAHAAVGVGEGGLVEHHVVQLSVGVAHLAFVDLFAWLVQNFPVGGQIAVCQSGGRDVVRRLSNNA